MVLKRLPVLPPDLASSGATGWGSFRHLRSERPLSPCDQPQQPSQATVELNAPDIIVRNEKRMLQESVDALLDNGRRGRPSLDLTSVH